MNVQVGLTDGRYTEILSGLNEGDEVVYRGYELLNENDPVVAAKWTQEGPAEVPPARGEEVVPGAVYSCPMHPEVEQSKPGDCPKCGMKLTPKNVVYTCPMHPEVKEKESGLCPKCMMKLQPAIVDPGTRAAGGGKLKLAPSGSGAPAPSEAAPSAAGKAAKGKYYCPMHPEVASDDPKATCQKCGGMKLVPRPAAKGTRK